MTNSNDDAQADLLIQEVDEDLRQEQMVKLWKQYANLFIGVAVAAVLAVAGWQAWNGWQRQQKQDSARRYSEAVDLIAAKKTTDAMTALDALAGSGTQGYRVLADLKRAEVRVAQGDGAAAAAILDSVAGSSADPLIKDLARLKSAYLQLDNKEPAVVEAIAAPLSAESSPWRFSAREILAMCALKRGDAARAREMLGHLADDPAAPQGLRARDAELLASIPVSGPDSESKP